jgi:Mn2+/Fe2+ NRAMP family transporter
MAASKAVEVTLGVVTSVGGFLEIGSIATAAQAGALFDYRLIWAAVVGGVCVAFLVEQSGRLAAVSGLTIAAAIRERFGFGYWFVLVVLLAPVSLLTLAAELGGVSIALEFATGIAYRWWAVPAMLFSWLLLWKGKFSIIEQGVSFLGLVTVCFIVGAFRLGPDWSEVLLRMAPSLPPHDAARYWFIAVSILGASITPYLMFFYSSGAIEDEWNPSYLKANRAIAGIGMAFGTLIAIGVLIVSALTYAPRGIEVDDYSKLAGLLDEAFGRSGLTLIVGSLIVACVGAALEITLGLAYIVAQGLGWNWSEDPHPRREARFCCTYTLVLICAGFVVLCGPDPLELTNFAMALTAATLPVAIVPFLFVMNDPRYVKEHRNGVLSNAVVMLIIGLAFVLALVAIPLELIGGS